MKQKYGSNFVFLIFAILLSVLCCTDIVTANQKTNCQYDKNSPSLQSARESLRIFRIECSINELNDFLHIETKTSAKDSAKALILLAEANYYFIESEKSRDSVAANYLLLAFKSDLEWDGELVIRNEELQRMLSDIRKVAIGQSKVESDVSAPLWKNKFVLGGIGGSIVAGIIITLISGGEQASESDPQTIPEFPKPPN